MVSWYSVRYATFVWLILSTNSVRDSKKQAENDLDTLQVSVETSVSKDQPSMQASALQTQQEEASQAATAAQAEAAEAGVVKAHTQSGAAGGAVSEKNGAKKTQFNIFHINLSWECMARVTGIGGFKPSGRYAAAHCDYGSFDGQKDVSKVTKWGWKLSEAEVAPAELITSCSDTFVKNLKNWNADDKFDVITMSELANPGKAGMQYLGREPEAVPDGKQQMDAVFYKYLKTNLLENYGVFGNVVVKSNVVTQATYWKKARLGDQPTVAVGVDMQQERPVSALFFDNAQEQVLVVNVHSAHFRQRLINNIDTFGGIEAHLTSSPNGFDYVQFPTNDLRDLFGKWITAKIREGLSHCTNFGPNAVGYCSGIDVSKSAAFANQQDWTAWKIIVAGDFNDETNELSQFKIFGIEVHSGPRKRTCCSDRDPDFKRAFEGNDYDSSKDQEFKTGLRMTQANADYFKKCGYFKSDTDLEEYLASSMNPMNLDGADRTPVVTGQTPRLSQYPFPSDMILSNLGGCQMDFPKNADGTNKYKQNVFIPMSDHDPIECTVQ